MGDISDEITSTLTGYCINTPSQSPLLPTARLID